MANVNSISGMTIAVSALTSFANREHLAAHNIANISTDGFRPVTANLADGPSGWGTALGKVRTADDAFSEARRTEGASVPSGTDLAVEFTSLIQAERSFQANAKTISVQDSLLGSLLEIKA